jgi:ATP-binding cassette, subfamily B, bacterial
MGVEGFKRTVLWRIVREVRPYWPQLCGTFVLSLLSTPLALLAPLPLKIVVDNVLGGRDLPELLSAFLPAFLERSQGGLLGGAASLVIILALLNQLRGLANWALQTNAGEAMVLDFRTKLFAHVQRLSLVYHDSKGTADSAFRIQYDAPAIQYVMVSGIIPMMSSLSLLIGMVGVAVQLDWQLAVICLGICPFLFLLTRRFSRRLRRGWREVKDLESSAHRTVHEALSAIRVVKAFGQETHERSRFRERSFGCMQEMLRVSMLQGLFDLAVAMTIATGTALTLYVGVRHVQSGVLTLGGLVLLLAYTAQLYGPLQVITNKLADLQASMVGAERAFALLDQSPEVTESPQPVSVARARGHVRFENVSFSYEGTIPVLQNVSLEARPGMRVGIQGRTGAGKSTLLSLLIRFYDVSRGRILLDGVDIRDFSIADLRNQFSIVLQDSILFSTSIAENIAYGRSGATKAEVIEAAKLANAQEFITALPDGYETLVGERGMRLSGGERQRVALARAFLKDAPILILDEPTSAVDIRTEGLILEALNRLMTGRTTFMIAHRLTTLDSCDLRLEITGGRLRALRPDLMDAAQ